MTETFNQIVNGQQAADPNSIPWTEIQVNHDGYNIPLGKLMMVLFVACAKLYSAITQDSLRVLDEELSKLTKKEENIAAALKADEGKWHQNKDGQWVDKDGKPVTNAQGIIDGLRNQLEIVRGRIGQNNTALTAGVGAASTMASVLGKIVASLYQAQSSVAQNI